MIKIFFGKRLVIVFDDIIFREDDGYVMIWQKERIQLINLLKVLCENEKVLCIIKNKNG